MRSFWALLLLAAPLALLEDGGVRAQEPCDGLSPNASAVEKLACISSPVLLRAMNPGLEIPACGETPDREPRVLPGNLPVSAVFLSCRADTANTCKEIAEQILQRKTGATVNILLNEAEIAKLQPTLSSISEAAEKSQSPLNILPVQGPVAAFLRDPGLFRTSQKSTEFVSNPYLIQGSSGSHGMSQAMNRCGLQFQTSYRDIASFHSAFALLRDDPGRELDALYGKEMGSYMRKGLEVPGRVEGMAIGKHWPTENEQGPLMGGNFLALPGDTLVVGASDSRKPDPDILRHFEKRQKVLQLQLPNLAVGHIDEVYNIVPSQGPCGYAVLRASPLEMKRFLGSRPADEYLGNLQDEVDVVDISFSKSEETAKIQREIMRLSSGAQATPSRKEKIKEAYERLNRVTERKKSVTDVLADSKLLRSWEQAEEVIQKGTKELIREIQTATRSDCQPDVVPLPVYWTVHGSPATANPVNGLSINGWYFYSKPNLIENAWGVPEEHPFPYPALEDEIQRRLKPLFPKGVAPVNTYELDRGKGNLHCATTNVYMPCLNQ